MAKGMEKHQERQARLQSLGKDLTRRSGARCELCGASGVPLRIYEVPPAPADPEIERCLYLCPTCREQLERPKLLDPNHWRCACESVWSEVPAVQVVAARVLDALGRREIWAREALTSVELDEEVASWVRQEPL